MTRRKNNIKGELELRRTQLWHVLPSFAHSFRLEYERRALNRLGGESDLEEDYHASGWFALRSNGFKRKALVQQQAEERQDGALLNDLVVSDDPKFDMTQHWWDEEGPVISPEDQFINVIDLTSSVTRNGGWCSAGSIEHRDQMIFASRFQNCIGHLFIIDTPGGSAYSKNDYEQGIAAARAAGQPVICWIDGMCCSAGVAASCQTDEIYVQHPNCEVGCIGTMAAFYTMADGTTDEDGYVYHELYDPESFDKNYEFRELANNNNADPICQDLAADGAAFRALVKANRPAIREEMLHGKVYKASELMGILVDGVKSYDEVIERFVELADGAELVPHVVEAVEEPEVEEPESPEDPEPKNEDDEKCKDDDKNASEDDEKCKDDKDKCKDDDKNASEDDDEKCKDDKDKCKDDDKGNENENSHINNKDNMKQYEHINAALELEAIAVTEDGSFYCNGALAEQLDAHLAQAEQNASLLAANNETVRVLNEKVKSLNEAKAQLDEQVAELTSKNEALEAEVAQKNNDIAALEADKQTLTEEKAGLETQHSEAVENINKQAETEKEELTQKVAELEASLEAKNAEIEELAKNTPAAPAPAPAAAEQTVKNSLHFYDGCKTNEERAKAFDEEMNRLRNRR